MASKRCMKAHLTGGANVNGGWVDLSRLESTITNITKSGQFYWWYWNNPQGLVHWVYQHYQPRFALRNHVKSDPGIDLESHPMTGQKTLVQREVTTIHVDWTLFLCWFQITSVHPNKPIISFSAPYYCCGLISPCQGYDWLPRISSWNGFGSAQLSIWSLRSLVSNPTRATPKSHGSILVLVRSAIGWR